MTSVLSLSNTSQFISGFYFYYNETSCFFGVIIFATRYDDFRNHTLINAPQLVWSANRDHPVEVNATLKFTGDGDLMLEDADGTLVWSTKTGRNKSIRGLRFTELGNLVIFDVNNTAVWQSFDHPTDSLLVGQKLVSGQKLIASTSSPDFSQGLFSLSIQYENNMFAFENGSFNGQNIPLGSTAQFMRLEPDGHLKVYEWGGAEWNTVADLLTQGIGDCGYPTVCGKYGICSNGQCGCLEGSSNEMGNFKQLSYRQPNLGCSLVTPITCNFSQYHSLFKLKNTTYLIYARVS
ncbi:hypothetical protein Vadar_013464 [Vaccinium darrowii]|uniref:Uncharacterized protein n=1 Tax=Vaccinium darrowii TaxID=229202 RepID=A0ACB7Z3N8_9ERIC|nr:hypothetical protein Vadar_013464 [Vaccinium darrowii]